MELRLNLSSDFREHILAVNHKFEIEFVQFEQDELIGSDLDIEEFEFCLVLHLLALFKLTKTDIL